MGSVLHDCYIRWPACGEHAAGRDRQPISARRLVGTAREFAGGGVHQHAFAVDDVLRHHDLDAGVELGRLRALGGGATLQFRRRLDHFQHHRGRQLDRHRLLVDDLHVDAGQAIGDVAGVVADHVRVQGVGGVVLVIEEHERVAVLVRIGGLAAQQFDLDQVVVGIEAGVELVAARHAVHDEAEADVAAATLRRAALDVADLVHAVVVLDDVALLDVVGFHGDLGRWGRAPSRRPWGITSERGG